MKENIVSIEHTYPRGYKIKTVDEQVKILHSFFPHLNTKYEANIGELSTKAEGFFAIPHWQKITKAYNDAVKVVFSKISLIRNFYNYYEERIGLEYLRQTKRTGEFHSELFERQKKNDILIVPAQFGICYKGYPVNLTRRDLDVDEFCLNSFMVGVMLLTHPSRLHRYKDLRIDAAGDEYSPKADGVFSDTPYFWFTSNDLSFSVRGINQVSEYCGSATGFLTKK